MNQFASKALLLVAFCMGTNSVALWPESEIPKEIPVYEVAKHLEEYAWPDSCVGMNYCFEKGEDYPDHMIAELLKDMRELPIKNPKQPINLEFNYLPRQGDPMENADCPANTTYTNRPIYYIKDTKGKRRVVIQSPTKFKQLYSIEWCLNPGRITTNTAHFLEGSQVLKNFNITCVDTIADFDIFVLNNEDKPMLEIAKVKGGIPVSCRCRYSNL